MRHPVYPKSKTAVCHMWSKSMQSKKKKLQLILCLKSLKISEAEQSFLEFPSHPPLETPLLVS